MTTPSSPRRSTSVSGPQKWCSPPEAFGQLNVSKRTWLPPKGNDLVEVAKFRAAVMQHVICLRVRKAKNEETFGPDGQERLTQEQLAALDPRPDTQKRWNARLCGRANLTTADIATLMVILPGAMPSEDEVRTFIEVAEKRIEPPDWWRWPDR
ncbi:hypothetical protein [Nocardioides panaciterrulae]|uniref:Uncharacterized protein n=1 Tax=Nocardioides panaciterrulae TaxID=661492 RepID=A0A7Y9J8Y4_9ACTN|nr:hypothetical protein [Nocardioides panaciterrulae]NYD40027.1 hypothetical protein [Nocardioides panaciterrulae]